MSGLKRCIPAIAAAVLTAVSLQGSAQAIDEVYSPPKPEDVRSDVLGWVAGQGMKEEAVLQQIGKIWAAKKEEAPSTQAIFDKVMETFSLVDAETRTFVKSCDLVNPSVLAPEPKPLSRENGNEFFEANMRLFYARYLTQRKMYDEALEQFSLIKPSGVIDPATYLYHKAVCEHQLLLKEEGLQTLETLLKSTQDVPVRYSTLATLMQHELKGIEEKSLTEVAHMMKDVERRLDLGRGGQRVQRKEAKVLATLDEIIEKLEQQGGNCSGCSGGNGKGRTNQPSGPMKDSQVGGVKGPGKVDAKRFRNQANWGTLPEKEQAKAKNLINRNFPAHYRQAVEEYFKKLADREANASK